MEAIDRVGRAISRVEKSVGLNRVCQVRSNGDRVNTLGRLRFNNIGENQLCPRCFRIGKYRTRKLWTSMSDRQTAWCCKQHLRVHPKTLQRRL